MPYNLVKPNYKPWTWSYVPLGKNHGLLGNNAVGLAAQNLRNHESSRLQNPRLVQGKLPGNIKYPPILHYSQWKSTGMHVHLFPNGKNKIFSGFQFPMQVYLKVQKTNKLRMKPSHNAVITEYITSSIGWIFPLSCWFSRGKNRRNKKNLPLPTISDPPVSSKGTKQHGRTQTTWRSTCRAGKRNGCEGWFGCLYSWDPKELVYFENISTLK